MIEKKETLKNQDKEAFFEEMNKLEYGEVFVPFFKESTDSTSQKLNLEEEEIAGKILGLSSYYRMVFSNRREQAFLTANFKTGEIIMEHSPLQIKVFSYKEKPIMTFYLIEPDAVNQDYKVDLHMDEGQFSLLPQDDDRILLDMISNFREKISQYQIEKGRGGDGGGAGHY